MAKDSGQGRPGGGRQDSTRPGKSHQTNSPKGPDKNSGGGIPPGKKP